MPAKKQPGGFRRSRSRTPSPGVLTPLTLAVAAAVVVEIPAGHDPHMPWKFTAFLVLTAGAAIVAVLVQSGGRARWTASLPAVLAGGFLSAVAVRATLTGAFSEGLVGSLFRYDGLWMYGACAVAFVLAWAFWPAEQYLRFLLGTTAFVVVWAMLEWAFGDPLLGSYQSAEREALESTIGNANFLAAYLGAMVGPIVAALLLARGTSGRWVAAAVLAGMALVLPATRSFQALPVAMASLLVVGAAWVVSLHGRARRLTLWGLGAAVVLMALGGVLVVAGIGPGADVRAREGGTIEARTHYWQVAIRMIDEEPLAGVGPARFGDEFAQRRPVENAVRRPFGYPDAPHNVVLKIAAEQGLIVATLYVGFVSAVGVALLRGSRRLEARELLILAGVAAAWLGYQVQSMVSIEVVPLMVIHWVTAGVALRAVGLTPPVTIEKPQSLERAVTRRPLAAVGSAVVVVLVVVLVSRPLRADLALADGRTRAASGDFAAARSSFERMRDLAPYEAEYRFLAGRGFQDAGQPALAMNWFEQAVRIEPKNPRYILAAVASSIAAGDTDQAVPLSEKLVAADPNNPKILSETVRFYLQVGRADQALGLSVRLTDLVPDDVEAWQLRLQAAQKVGQDDEISEARKRLENLAS